MAKRTGDNEDCAKKKIKLDDFNDIWGDDLDGDVIDDCFERASQICEKDRNASQINITLSTSYSVFKRPSDMVTSTQIPPENVQDKLKELQEKYAEKEGEVGILRANLQNLRTTCQAEQEKKEKEWKEKLNAIQKENKTVRSELQFKNLEIANLKQQITEVSKFVNVDQNSTKKSRITESRLSSPHKPVKETQFFFSVIQINSKPYYPLRCFNSSSIFKPISDENCIIKTKYNLYKTAYLQNPSVQEQVDFLMYIKQKPILINEKELNLDYVYPELALLINLSADELNSNTTVLHLNKIVCVSLQLLTDLYHYLKQIEENIQLQDIQESDSQYLQLNSTKKHESLEDAGCLNEIGMKSGKLLEFLAEILPFSDYFKNYLLKDYSLNLDRNLDYVKLLPCLTTKVKKEFIFLTLILDIVSFIGRTRKEQMCSEFLCALVNLLCRIYSCKESDGDQLNSVIYEIVREVLFLRPNFKVIYRLTFLLEVASRDTSFINCLCSEGSQNKVNNTVKGVLYFNKESCRFYMFVILLENVLPKINSEKVVQTISFNVLNFIYNIFISSNNWLYDLENKQCICLCRLYKLGIGIIYRNLKAYQEFTFEDRHIYRSIFKNGIKILHLLTSNSYDLTQKYVTDFAQFKEIIFTLARLYDEIGLDEQDLKNLEKLGIVEDFPEVPKDKFIGIDL